MRHRLWVILTTADPEPAELTLGLVLALFGLVLWLPGNTFATAPSYAAMSHIAMEEVWAAVTMFVGLLAILAVLSSWHYARLLCSFLLLLSYGVIGSTIMLSNHLSALGSGYTLLAAVAFWAYMRIGRQ